MVSRPPGRCPEGLTARRKVPVPDVIPRFVAYSTVPTSQDCLTIRRRAADSGEGPPVPIQIAPFLGNVVGSRQYPQTLPEPLRVVNRAYDFAQAPASIGGGLLTYSSFLAQDYPTGSSEIYSCAFISLCNNYSKMLLYMQEKTLCQ